MQSKAGQAARDERLAMDGKTKDAKSTGHKGTGGAGEDKSLHQHTTSHHSRSAQVSGEGGREGLREGEDGGRERTEEGRGGRERGGWGREGGYWLCVVIGVLLQDSGLKQVQHFSHLPQSERKFRITNLLKE